MRDQIHSEDVIVAFDAFAAAPCPGEVYNLGRGRANSVSILEAFNILESRLKKPVQWRYTDSPCRGNHICYISDLSESGSHYPN